MVSDWRLRVSVLL